MRIAAAVLFGVLAALVAARGHCGAADAAPGSSIAHAGGWRMIEPPDPAGCTARLQGPDVDTMLAVNKDNKLVLVAGRRDWNLAGGAPNITLQIDNLPPRTVQAAMAANLVMVLADDPTLYRQLRQAKRIAWALPVGNYSAGVAGLGAAFDAALACKRSHPTPAG